LDVLYTDPAPLEALLQRFGRVNRGREERVLCPVNVFREPDTPEEGKEPLYLPYDRDMVERSIEVLEQFCGGGRLVDESLVTAMLDEIYKDAIAERWWQDYNDVKQSFETAILGGMKPFQSATREM